MENQIGNVAGAELQAVIALELVAVDTFAVDERTVLAALIEACSRDTRGSAITKSRSTFRPTV
jgi:hypothetical protein